MITAFQSNAFQNDAFQIAATDTHDGDRDRKHDEKRKRRDEEFKRQRERMREMITYAFDKAYGLLPPEFAEVREVAEPFVEASANRVEIDWKGLQESVTAEFKLKALYEQYAAELAERDDEETLMVLH